MPHPPFSEEWITQFSDPYAVLGLSVAADDRRALKRYRSLVKRLHPDSQSGLEGADREFANQLFAKLVNPAYQRLKQEKGRAETLALLRFRVRRLTRDEPLNPQYELARRLLTTPVPAVEMFYEQAIDQLAEVQYDPLDQFEAIAHELAELNLVYLRLKMGEPMIREKRTGLVSAPQTQQAREFAPVQPKNESYATVSYAERHYLRAQEYLKKANCQLAVQELRDAIRIEADKGKYHALMAKAYIMQNLSGAAKAYCRKALELDPSDRLAQACAKRLNIDVANPDRGKTVPSRSQEKDKGGGIFGLFARKR